MCICGRVWGTESAVPTETREDVRSSGAGVTGSCELADKAAGIQL